MSYGKQATSGYSSVPAGGSPVETESWALIECARRLSEASRVASKKAMMDALRLNWRLWTIFQAELSAEYCTIPDDIRINMLTLCQFVDKHTVSTMIEPTPEKLKVLIDMNRNIAAGQLAGQESSATAAQAQPPVGGEQPAQGAVNTIG